MKSEGPRCDEARKEKNCYYNSLSKNLCRAHHPVRAQALTSYCRAAQNEIFEQSEVRRAQTSGRVPALNRRKSIRTTPRIVPADNVVQAIEPFSVQPRIEESERGKPCSYSCIVQERDHRGESLIGKIRTSECGARLGVSETYGCAGAGTSNGIDLTTYYDLEV